MRKTIGMFFAVCLVMFFAAPSFGLDIMGGGLFSTEVEIVSFHVDKAAGDLTVVARVCPPYLFGRWVSGSSMRPKLLQAIGGKVSTWKRANPDYVVRRENFEINLETSMLRSAESGNRCSGGTAMYSVTKKASAPKKSKQATVVADSKLTVLKVGVRDKFPMVSVKGDDKSWNGAAILFSQSVAKKLGTKIQFVELPSAPKCLKATKYGMVDMSISLISYTPKRAHDYKLSTPYFDTGIVAATLNMPTLALANKEGFNSGSFTILVGEGTTAESLARERFPKAEIKTLPRTPEVYEEAKRIEAKTEQGKLNGIIMLTDEVIALTWPGSFVIEYKGNRLYTKDKYVAVARTKGIQAAINSVIEEDNIPGMYADLVGR